MNDALDHSNTAEHHPQTTSVPSPSSPPMCSNRPIDLNPQSTWPKVIGILSIVFGCLGILTSIAHTIVTIVAFSGGISIWPSNTPPTLTINSLQGILRLTYPLFLFASSITLFIAGLMLLPRRSFGIKLHSIWAKAWLPTIIIYSIFFTYTQWASYTQAGKPLPAWSPTQPATLFAVLPILALCAYPTTLLFWLNRPAIKREYQTWNQPSTPPVITMTSQQDHTPEPMS